MDPRLLRWGDVLASTAGIALLVALGLAWYDGRSGWSDLAVLRVFLALVALSGLALGVVGSLRRTVSLPIAAAVFATPLGLVATVTLAIRTALELDESVGTGAWLGLLCVIGIFLGAFFSMKDEGTDTPQARAQTERVLAIRGQPRPAPPPQAPPERSPAEGGG